MRPGVGGDGEGISETNGTSSPSKFPLSNQSFRKVLKTMWGTPHGGPAQNMKTPTLLNPPGGGRRDCVIVIYIRLSFNDNF